MRTKPDVPTHPSRRTPRSGPSRRTAGSTDVDPEILAAITDVVRLVQEEQDEGAKARKPDEAARSARPVRPALRRLYDVPGAAAQLSLSESKVWALIRAARLRTVKVDSRTLVTAAELDRFVAEEVHPG